ncbi:MAG: hypothetical protein AAGG50_10000 [Bacteroidota bacterium]
MSVFPDVLKADPVLSKLAALVPVPPLEPPGDVFHDLVGCLVEQQHPARSTKGTFQRSLDRAGLDRVTPDLFEHYEERGLADVRLSLRKRDALASTVDFFRAHDLDWTALSDDEVRAHLRDIQGVGPWTIDMVLLFTLRRPDVFPADDYHLKQLMAHHYGIEGTGARLKRRMRDLAEGWRPHRSAGVRLLLAWKAWQRELAR